MNIGREMISAYDCIKVIWEEGSNTSPLKKKRVLDKLRKMKGKKHWDDYIDSLDEEWQWRICCAKLHLGELSWKGWEYRNIRNGMVPFNFPKWNKEKVGKLLVYGEQGIGDEVMFSQVLPELRLYADSVTFECMDRLAPLFKRSFPWLEVVGRTHYMDGAWATDFDFQVALGDLLPIFRTKRSQFLEGTYLVPDPKRVELFEQYRGMNGLSWWGRQARLDPLDLPKGVSLQYGDEDNPFFDAGIDLTNDIEGVFALTSVLDRVITVPTSIAHFAGAMGVKTEVIQCPIRSGVQNSAINWRFSELHNKGKQLLWHPSVTIHKNIEEYKNAMEGHR